MRSGNWPKRFTPPLDPTLVPAMMAGGIWRPEDTTTSGGGDLTVLSQATQTNTLQTATVTGDFPVLTTASNGAAVWDYNGLTYPSLAIPDTGNLGTGPGVGSALQWTTRGSIGFWAKQAAQTSDSRFLLSCSWDVAGQARLQVRKNLGTGASQDKISIELSWTGNVTDGPPGERAKYNSEANVVDFTKWHYWLIDFDWSLDNYLGDGGEYRSHRMKLYLDFVQHFDTGPGYSAPNPSNGGTPPDGPIHDPGLWPSTSYMSYGANGISGSWNGQLGMLVIANGAVDLATWKRVARFHAPA